jgi:hypothetical protein
MCAERGNVDLIAPFANLLLGCPSAAPKGGLGYDIALFISAKDPALAKNQPSDERRSSDANCFCWQNPLG